MIAHEENDYGLSLITGHKTLPNASKIRIGGYVVMAIHFGCFKDWIGLYMTY